MSAVQQSGHDDDPSSRDPLRIDKDFFDQFFKEHFSRLCLQCQYKYGFDLDLAKEVVHTAFIKLWETRYNLSTNFAVKSYIDKIITNNCLDILKHEKVKLKYQRMVMETDTYKQQASDFLTGDLKQMTSEINRAVAELPEQMRKIFEMSRYEELKYTTIADQLGISVKTVETQMSRALQKLRIKLSHYLTEAILFISLLHNFHK